jgi:hypothetical protein
MYKYNKSSKKRLRDSLEHVTRHINLKEYEKAIKTCKILAEEGNLDARYRMFLYTGDAIWAIKCMFLERASFELMPIRKDQPTSDPYIMGCETWNREAKIEFFKIANCMESWYKLARIGHKPLYYYKKAATCGHFHSIEYLIDKLCCKDALRWQLMLYRMNNKCVWNVQVKRYYNQLVCKYLQMIRNKYWNRLPKDVLKIIINKILI